MTDELRVFLYRGNALEHDLQQFQDAGFNVGAIAYSIDSTLIDEALAPFSVQLRDRAAYMSKIYSAFYCFENLLRQYVKESIQTSRDGDWKSELSGKIVKKIEDRKNKAVKGSWLVASVGEDIDYADFGDLKDIIISNWESFADIIPSQHWLSMRMDELESARNFTAHHRTITPSEAARIYMYIRDFTNVLGL